MTFFETGYMSSWRDPEEVDALAGDKVDFNRGWLYNHVGIADGEGGVFHYTGDGGSSGFGKNNIQHRHDKIKDVAKGQKVRINNSEDRKMDPKPGSEIVRRAKDKLGTGRGQYNVVTNNCEHNATDTRYGEPVSEQSSWWQNLGWTLAAIGSGVLALFGIVSKRNK